MNKLEHLDNELYNYFTYIDSTINLNSLKTILDKYKGIDWKDYIIDDYSTDYLKNIFNSKYNQQLYAIIIITWNPSKYIKIHNHAKNGCIFKILEGSLIENKFDTNLNPISHKILQIDDISFIHNSSGYHSINTEKNRCISIHIYSPADYITKFIDD